MLIVSSYFPGVSYIYIFIGLFKINFSALLTKIERAIKQLFSFKKSN